MPMETCGRKVGMTEHTWQGRVLKRGERYSLLSVSQSIPLMLGRWICSVALGVVKGSGDTTSDEALKHTC